MKLKFRQIRTRLKRNERMLSGQAFKCGEESGSRQNNTEENTHIARISWYFLARAGKIRVEVTGHRRHCKQLCGGMEIPCRLVFSCSSKVKLNRLKELLENKIRR